MRTPSLALCAGCLAVLLCAGVLPASEPSREPGSRPGVFTLDTLHVVAERPSAEDRLRALAGFATVHRLERTGATPVRIGDVIEEGAGVRVTRYGWLGSVSTPSIRASAPGQVEVYLDGVPLQSAGWGTGGLPNVPVSHLERVEVYRGVAPAGFGSAGIGGIVNLVSAAPAQPVVGAELTVGSFGTRSVDVSRAGRWADGRYSVSLHHLTTDGDYEYLDRHGTPENPEDDETVPRANAGLEETGILGRLTLPAWRGVRLTVADELSFSEGGVPGRESVQTENVSFESFRNLARASLESVRPLPLGLRVSGTAYRRDGTERFRNPDDETGFPRSGSTDESVTYGVNALVELRPPVGPGTLRLSGESRWDRYTPESENPSVGRGFERRRRTGTLVGEAVLPLPGSVEVVPSYRYQESVDNFATPDPVGGPPEPLEDPHWSTHHAPAVGARWSPSDALQVKAHYADYARFPTTLELFGSAGSVDGNPEIEPERGTTFDAGLLVRPSSTSHVELVFFRCRRENLIVFLENSQRTVKAQNIEAAEVEGLEASFAFGGADVLRLSGSYTVQRAVNDGPSPVYGGNRLPHAPDHDLFLRLGRDTGPYAV
ncbi:MAG: TonB-dependent receptor, partial [Candidatus Eisenbacteria bacterium]|nr:TonB-dependent receptor [Candidatus Eisenbacteria bacterium]